MTINRRDFLKLSATAAGGCLLCSNVLSAESKSFGNNFAMLNDSTKCIGCRACQTACKSLHGLENTGSDQRYDMPDELNSKNHTLIKLYSENGKHVFIKRQCMHCNEPACVSACPVSALQKQSNGVVSYNKDKCIGCRYCMVACPFDVPTFEYDNPFPVIQKCTFCESNLKDGKQTECAAVCPTGAIKFGTRDEMLKEAETRIKENPDKYVSHIYGQKEVGGTSVLYLSDIPFEKLGLRTLKEEPPQKIAEDIQHTVFKHFIPPATLFGALGLVMLKNRKAQSDDSDTEGKE